MASHLDQDVVSCVLISSTQNFCEITMNCDQLIDVILAIGRLSVLVIGMFAGIFSVYLGWSLYRDRTTSKTSGEASFKDLKISLTAAGPGVFLALFGAYLLVSIINHKVDLSTSEPAPVTVKPTNWQSASTSSAIRLVLVADKKGVDAKPFNESTTSSPCLIRQRNRVLFDGAVPLTSVQIADSLEVAVKSVGIVIPQTEDDVMRAQLRRSLTILQELRSSVAK